MIPRLPIVSVLLAAAVPVLGQQLQFDLTAGYQWLDVSGNGDVYRTQAGEKEGLALDSLRLTVSSARGATFFDRLHIEAAGIGETATSTVRVTGERAGTFRLRLAYLRAEVFNAVPGIANPFAGSGVAPGQHTLNRQRDLLDLEVELLPGKKLTPIIGYTRTTLAGPARTTVHLGGDEFQLASDLDEAVDEYRLGLAFDVAGVRGGVIQGWRDSNTVETLSLLPGAGGGNSGRPVLDRDIAASAIERTVSTSARTPFTTAWVQGRLTDRLRLVGTFARTDAESEVSELDEAAGQFVSFALRRFFLGLAEETTGRATSPAWRGDVRLEAALLDWLDLTAAYTTSHRELDGRSLLTSRYVGTTNYSGVELGDLTAMLDARTAWERDDEVVELRADARPLPFLRVWGARAKVQQDVTVTPAAAEIVLPGGQGGSYTREVDRTSAGAALALGGVSVSAEWTGDDANEAVVRTDFLERDALRVRAGLRLASWLRVAAVGEHTQASNATPGIDSDFDTRRWGADVEVAPWRWLSLRGNYGTFDVDSRITVRRPHDFGLEPSLYLEDGDEAAGALVVSLGRFGAQAGAARLHNRGTLPFTLDRRSVRLEVHLMPTLGLVGHWEQREYDETLLASASYDARRYGLLLHWHGQ